MKGVVLCEETGRVTEAFRERGHEFYSCDLQPTSGNHPEWHLQMDAFEAVEKVKPEIIIAHPPCTYLSRAGARWMYPTAGNICNERYQKAMAAKDFFLRIWNLPVQMICIENPTPLRVIGLPRYSQSIEPYQYGHPFSKRTLLWIKGLPFLQPTNILTEYKPLLPSNTGFGRQKGQQYQYANISQKDSSKTFAGIASAMAEQWG